VVCSGLQDDEFCTTERVRLGKDARGRQTDGVRPDRARAAIVSCDDLDLKIAVWHCILRASAVSEEESTVSGFTKIAGAHALAVGADADAAGVRGRRYGQRW
jgi:hypothetical protein